MSSARESEVRLLRPRVQADGVEQPDVLAVPDGGSTGPVGAELRPSLGRIPEGEGATAEATFACSALRAAGFHADEIFPITRWFNRKDHEEMT